MPRLPKPTLGSGETARVEAVPRNVRKAVAVPTVRVARVDRTRTLEGRGRGMLPAAPRDPFTTGRRLPDGVGAGRWIEVGDVSGAPWACICSIQSSWDRDVFMASGWIAGPNTVLTAGHAIYDHGRGRYADSVFVMPGRRGDRAIAKQEVGRNSLHVFEKWMNSERCGLDIGWIDLPVPFPAVTGQLACTPLPDTTFRSRNVKVSVGGYPIDSASGDRQYFSDGAVVRASASMLFYRADTERGQSGSPVWVHDGDLGLRYAVAIHAYGYDDAGRSCTGDEVANAGSRLTVELLEQIGLPVGDALA